MQTSLALKAFPKPWEWKDWVAALHLEVARLVAPHGARVMSWLGRAEQLDAVSDSALEDSEEFPRLDVLLADELFKTQAAVARSFPSE